jgi:hypothetical protein
MLSFIGERWEERREEERISGGFKVCTALREGSGRTKELLFFLEGGGFPPS